jgi:2-polyprenyl-3-methyl-5-hydroxy-6-metoxy-1,4-benzoquinol methylase
MTTTAVPQFDQTKFDAALGRFLGDAGAAFSSALVLVGDKLGLYKALNEGGAQTARQLAERTGTHERYVREWLSNQAASGYITYDPETRTFALPAEHVPFLADDTSEVTMFGLFSMAAVLFADEPKITEVFKTGQGLGWHEHDQRLFACTERLFRPGYRAHLVADWIPALDGVAAKLRAGARVADIGCGFGTSTILMANAYPAASFVGYDYHVPSIEAARSAASAAGLSDRVTFEVASARDLSGDGFDLVCCFDCIHDMGDPVGVLSRLRRLLKQDGTLMMVEPFASDTLEENLNPIGRIFYAASTMLCTPASRAQEVGLALGAQAGEIKMRAVATEAGFSKFRRASETPFNLVYELRP